MMFSSYLLPSYWKRTVSIPQYFETPGSKILIQRWVSKKIAKPEVTFLMSNSPELNGSNKILSEWNFSISERTVIIHNKKFISNKKWRVLLVQLLKCTSIAIVNTLFLKVPVKYHNRYFLSLVIYELNTLKFLVCLEDWGYNFEDLGIWLSD